MNGHRQQQQRESSSTSNSLLESLGQLDLSGFKNERAAVSYDRLLETAQMISALNVGKDLATVKDRGQFEATLTKLLQVSQTIIDCLLKRSSSTTASGALPAAHETSRNEVNLAYQNNLRQENAKLRKLLSLQQKAIAFRRANLWTVSDNNNTNTNTAEDVSTSAAVDVSLGLPEDCSNESVSANNNNSSKSFLQCIYCPKIFTDSNSFAKHLSLRHLSSSIDDGLPSSIGGSSSGGQHQANNNSFMQRLHQQYQKALEMRTINNNNNIKSSAAANDNAEVINRLQAEIVQLKAKLTATEQALEEEKSARASFESDLKKGLEGNVQQLQAELAAKIEEVRSLVVVGGKQGAPVADDHCASSAPTIIDGASVDDAAQVNEAETAIPTASQLKQSLRLKLISQLTSKRSEPSYSGGKVHQQLQQKIEQGVPPTSEDISSKELTKAEISTSIESRLREYLQQQQQQQQQPQSSVEDESVTEAEAPTTSSNLDERHYSTAMSKVHRDRELLIQQSRHDYDFVAIESSLRELIDSKLRSKLQAAEDLQEEVQGLVEETKDDQQQLMHSAPPPNDKHQAPPGEQQQPSEQPVQPLKSILKSPRRAGARPKTRRRSFDENDDQSTVNSRRISFSEQIIEFPISPRESEGEQDSDDADDDADLGFVVGNIPATTTSTTSTRRNQMFVIRSLDGGDDDQDQEDTYLSKASRQLQLQQQSSPLADSFAREKIFINEYSTSSSSSSSEEEVEEEQKEKGKTAPSSSNREVVVEVHQQPPSSTSKMPVPAARRNKPSTLDSLLLGDDSPAPPPVEPSTATAKQPPTSSSTRVQELAELIERKLQQKQRSSLTAETPMMIGAVDTVASLRPSTSKNTDIDYDIYDF